MKLSSSAIRQSRIARGWSQEQLAIAAGLSLRTVQRVESEGMAALSTAASLAATFGVPLAQLQEVPAPSQPQKPEFALHGVFCLGVLYLGLAILMIAFIGESGRLPGPRSAVDAAMNVMAALVGAALVIPAALQILRSGQYAGVVLAILGVPLTTLLLGGLIYAALTGHAPTWQLLGIGLSGVALVVMSMRAFRHGTQRETSISPDRSRQSLRD